MYLTNLYNALRFRAAFFFISIFASAISSKADVKPAKIFSDNMVLQRGLNFPVWGTASPGEKIMVSISDQLAYGMADSKGDWKIVMPQMKSGGPFKLSIKGNNTVEFNNVLVGDVWLASGQSNMEWKLKDKVNNYEQEMAAAKYPEIRLFTVANVASPFPKADLQEGKWVECTPETAGDFSAVAYFFGRDIYQKEHVPIGLIDCTWGGTTVEAWTSYQMLYTIPSKTSEIGDILEKKENWETDIEANVQRTAKRAEIAVHSNLALEKGVTKSNFNDFEWPIINIPSWDKDVSGVIWMRKKIEIPSQYKKQDLVLNLGKPLGTAEVYFNDEKIGSVSGPNYVELKVPGNLVKSGENHITVRLAHPRYNDHLSGDADKFYLSTSTGVKIADLTGEWKYNNKLEPELPEIKFYYRYPAALFNGMVSPIAGYGIKGIIWYQGENNVDNASEYYDLFPAMIQDWRIRWQQGYVPFIFVQLANYKDPAEEPGESDFATLRDAQLSALKLPNTGMAVTIDIGEQFSIHPKNKQDVGKRLALAARHLAYGEDIVWSGPIFRSMEIDDNEIAVTFDHVDGGLVAKDGPLQGFAIAGNDKKFYWATAKIAGGKIYLSNEKVKNPVAVRYAWADNPDKANLYNKAGLPASPFRTDNW